MTETVTREIVLGGGRAGGRPPLSVLRLSWSAADPLAVVLVVAAKPEHPSLLRGRWVVLRDRLREALSGGRPVDAPETLGGYVQVSASGGYVTLTLRAVPLPCVVSVPVEPASNLRQFVSAAGVVHRYGEDRLSREVDRADVVVDAIFGTGFRGSPANDFARAIELVNDAAGSVVAVDIPSGVEGETGLVRDSAVYADARLYRSLAGPTRSPLTSSQAEVTRPRLIVYSTHQLFAFCWRKTGAHRARHVNGRGPAILPTNCRRPTLRVRVTLFSGTICRKTRRSRPESDFADGAAAGNQAEAGQDAYL